VKYSDIVILLRSLKDWGTDFVQVLTEQGIPAHVESSTGYFSAVEVQTVLCMLQILDNPYQDISYGSGAEITDGGAWTRKNWHRSGSVTPRCPLQRQPFPV